jgi:Uma2 family endonuclease
VIAAVVADLLTRRSRRAYARRIGIGALHRAAKRWRSMPRELSSSAHARARFNAEEEVAVHMATKLKRWTLEELHSLPDDGNKYELIRGELFVTPPPTDDHETILARLTRILDRFVEANGLGQVYHPRAVFRFEGSEVEPDLMVRQEAPGLGNAWEKAPLPMLIVELLSPTTRRRDQMQKKDFYRDARIPEYWIVDPEQAAIKVIRSGEPAVTVRDTLVWQPAGVPQPLTMDVARVFG